MKTKLHFLYIDASIAACLYFLNIFGNNVIVILLNFNVVNKTDIYEKILIDF